MNSTAAASPTEYLKSCLTKDYANFSGRARRSEYWFCQGGVYLISALLGLVLGLLGGAFNLDEQTVDGLASLLSLIFFIPILAVSVRRLHDTGRSDWWLLIWFVPVLGWFYFLYLMVQDSQPEPNKWGPSPKYAGALADPFGAGGPPAWGTPAAAGGWAAPVAGPGPTVSGPTVSSPTMSSQRDPSRMGLEADTLPADPGERKYGR